MPQSIDNPRISIISPRYRFRVCAFYIFREIMAFEMLKTDRGNDMLSFDGYLFVKEKESAVKSIWKCNQYFKNKCRGRVHLSDGKILKNTDHNHVPNSTDSYVQKTLNVLKEIATNNIDASTHSVVATALSQIPTECAAQLPNIHRLKRTIQRVRKQQLKLPNDPTDFNFIIPEEMTKTTDGNLFLQYDSGINTDRILIFSTTNLLKLMAQCNNWFCDGTFSSAPSLFYQVYIIHAVQYSNVLPSAYILLPDKKEITYRRMFQALKTLSIGLSPKTIMVDFEKAAMNAINYEFPETEIKGCFFHFSQCM